MLKEKQYEQILCCHTATKYVRSYSVEFLYVIKQLKIDYFYELKIGF